MARFKYIAKDEDGQAVSGFTEADSAEDVHREFESRGLTITDLQFASDDEDSVWEVDSAATEAVTQAGQLAAAGVPLPAGLRALAEETSARSLRTLLSELARRLDAGEQIEDVLESESSRMPAYLRGIVHVGSRIGDLASGIEHFVHFSRQRALLRNRIRISIAYPAILIVIAALIMGAAMYFIMPQFRSIYDGFGTELPGVTVVLIRTSLTIEFLVEHWFMSVFGLGSLLLAIPRITRVIIGPVAWMRFLYLVPLYGPTLRNGSLSEYCHLLSILIEHQIPLPEALRLAGDGVSDRNLREGSYLLSRQVEEGLRPDATSIDHFPRDILSVMSWQKRESDFGPGEALKSAGDIYAAHTEVHSRSLTAIIEPVAIVMVALFVGFFVVSLFMPLVRLVKDLS